MKRISYSFFFTLFALMITSCYNKSLKENVAEVADTISIKPIEKAQKPVEWDKVASEVEGPVKTITQHDEVIKFSREGKITSWTASGEEVVMNRSNGRISYIGAISYCCDFAYDFKKGRLLKTVFADDGGHGSVSYTLIYNDEGKVTSVTIVEKESEDGGPERLVSNKTYPIHDVEDSHGNWISRTIDGYTTKRKITYYE